MAYTALDLTTAVQDDLKDSSFNSTRILRYLNEAQRAIFNTHTFRFCEKAVSGALTAGEHNYDQQDDHQATIGGYVEHDTIADKRLVLNSDSYLASREFFERFPEPSAEDSDFPSYWTEFSQQIYFNCPAASTYTFVMRYYRTPTALTGDASVPEVPEEFREMLELYCLYKAEKYRGNHDVAATYKQEYENQLENMVLRYSDNLMAFSTVRQTRTRVDDSL